MDGLTLLSDALDGPLPDLQAVISVFTDDLIAAIPTFFGLTVTLFDDDVSAILTTLDPGHAVQVRASLLLPLLRPPGESATASSVAFYSGSSGAFIDLADHARWIFDLTGPPVLDSHLSSAGGEPGGIRGLTELSDPNQAVEVLVEDGHTQLGAQQEFRRRATQHGHPMPDVARRLHSDLPGPENATGD